MRLADVVLRRGHLSEDALVEVWTSGLHPAHLDECALCASRAIEMSRWLEDVQATGRAEADAVCADDRMRAQRSQVLDRLAQLDRPSKVISFPAATASARESGRRQMSAGWVAAAAAAAGIMIGIIGIELSHMLRQPDPPAISAAAPAPPQMTAEDVAILEGAYDRPSLSALQPLEDMTPRVSDLILASNR